jgi:hypothetical protein
MSKRTMLPQSVRFTVFRRDNFTCRYCGRSSPAVVLHVEHVQAVANGGSDDPSNLVTACADCNGGKGVIEGVTPPEAVDATIAPAGLAGLWAHELDDEGYANRQMRILRPVGGDRWLVQLFSWLTGEPGGCEVVPESALLSDRYALYVAGEDMNHAYESGKRRHPEWLQTG